MKRAVITGMGIVSSIGNNLQNVLQSLKTGKSGISFSEQFKEAGLKSNVWGAVDLNLDELIDRKVKRFMGDAAAYAYLAMQQAVEDSGLSESEVSNEKTGLICGSGGASSRSQVEAYKRLYFMLLFFSIFGLYSNYATLYPCSFWILKPHCHYLTWFIRFHMV